MATIGNLINPNERQLDQNQTNPLSVLAEIIYKRSEEQRLAEVDKQNRMQQLQEIAKANTYLNDSQGMSKAGYLSDNPDRFGVQVTDITNGKFNYKVTDSEADLPKLQMEAAKVGINPANMSSRTIIQTMAKKQAEKIDFENNKLRMEEENKIKQQEMHGKMLQDSARQTLRTVSELKKGLKYFGAAGDLPPFPAEYNKKNWVANYNQLKDKLVVDLMLKLKESSKTGSTGFGALTEKEGMRLENASSALQKGLSEGDALKYLTEIENSANNILSADGGSGGGESRGNIVIMEDALGNKAEVEVDANGNPIRVLREL